jgi:hypothetical protein
MNAASELGKLSAKKRKMKLGAKAYREYMREIARRPRPSRRKQKNDD